MKSSKLFALVLATGVLGAAAGGGATYALLSQEVADLEQKFENSNTVRIVQENTSGSALPVLFEDVDQSVVSIRAYGSADSQGSGFVYSENGYIVTNEHVVDESNMVEVTFTEGGTYRARIVGMDQYSDLAVLKVQKRRLEPLELGNLSDVQVGQRTVAIGNPFGLPGTMTSGIISQKNRNLNIPESGFSIPNVLQTDAAINPGNSGGPLLNTQGELIGVNSAINSQTGTFSGVGFAIPVSAVKRVVPELIEEGDVEHPWIGIQGVNVDSEIANEMELENATGFLVVGVTEDGPADRAGLQSGEEEIEWKGRTLNIGGDVVIAINDEEVNGINDILTYLATSTEVGETVTLTVIRDGEREQIELNLAAREDREN